MEAQHNKHKNIVREHMLITSCKCTLNLSISRRHKFLAMSKTLFCFFFVFFLSLAKNAAEEYG